MSAMGTDDRFLRAAFVEGNGSGVSEAPFSVVRRSIRAPVRWTQRYCAEIKSHLRRDSRPGLTSEQDPAIGIYGQKVIQHP
jgi:hypothetical protein